MLSRYVREGNSSWGTPPAFYSSRSSDLLACGQLFVVYKVDRPTRSLADFAKLVEMFDAHSVSFISVTQAFNTTTSMGRLTLNMLLSFAQFEREITGERIRDKVAASKRKGIWMGGAVPLGYRVEDRVAPRQRRTRHISIASAARPVGGCILPRLSPRRWRMRNRQP